MTTVQQPTHLFDSLSRAISFVQEEQGFTTAEVAQRCGWTEDELRARLSHPARLTIDDLNAIAEALNVRLSALMRDAQAFDAGREPEPEQSAIAPVPQWATVTLIEQRQRDTEGLFFHSFSTDSGSLELTVLLRTAASAAGRCVMGEAQRLPTVVLEGERGHRRKFTLAEARSAVAGRSAEAYSTEDLAALSELLDAYDSAARQ